MCSTNCALMSEYLKRSDVINALKDSELLADDNLTWAIEIVRNVPTVEIKTEEEGEINDT